MKEKETTKDNDLEAAKAFLCNMLAPLDEDERKKLLKMLLNLTDDADFS
ncbi:MAG: hypothetical protein IJ002_09270 [Clostridia bacterium]|nr:hypothetical protein [Clostridia bacterium]